MSNLATIGPSYGEIDPSDLPKLPPSFEYRITPNSFVKAIGNGARWFVISDTHPRLVIETGGYLNYEQQIDLTPFQNVSSNDTQTP